MVRIGRSRRASWFFLRVDECKSFSAAAKLITLLTPRRGESEASMSRLETLRQKLGVTDREILELIAQRQDLAAQIGALKEKAGRATRDFGQEKEVVERARAWARECQLSPQFAERLMQMLIEYSLTRQEQQRVVRQASGGGRRVLIIGGSGRMGAWFVRFLASQGFELEVADPAKPVEGFDWRKDWRDGSLDHDFIVLAAHLRATQEMLPELAERHPPGVVFDVASLKSPLREGLRKLVQRGIRATSIHPMFGPNTELLSQQHVVFVDLGVPEATLQVRALFDSTMALQVEMDLEDHDRLIAYVLGLSHALNIAFFTALAESGEAAPKLAQLSSTTFNAQLEVAAAVARDNPHLYFEIQHLNDYGTESLSALLYAVERLRSVIRAGDESGFVKLMEKGNFYLAGRQK